MQTTVNIDGKPICFDISTADGKEFSITIGEACFATRVVKNSLDCITVDVNGSSFVVQLEGDVRDTALCVEEGEDKLTVQTDFLDDLKGLTKALKKKEALKKASTDAHECRDLNGAVVASMPGKVVAVCADIGQRIEEDDVVCTLEAMKMQNEILAPLAGTIKEICCHPGDLVEKGDVLFRIG